MSAYTWEKFQDPWFWDSMLEQNAEILMHGFYEAMDQWSENRKIRNDTMGEDRAQQELAFRDYIVSEKSEKIGNSEKFFWITVNPRTGGDDAVPLDEFVKTIHKMYKKKWILSYMYVFENTDKGHFHSHGLIRAKYEAKRAFNECSNTVKHVCNTAHNSCFHFVELKDEAAVRQKFDYMMGFKQDRKKPNVQLTIDWRAAESLLDYYSSEVPLILLGPREGEKDLTVPEGQDTAPWDVLTSDMDVVETFVEE
jgi:hypothetical protein